MTGPQSYLTNPDLARAVSRLATRVDATQYVELGVGEAALWDELPSPKVGVELRDDPIQRRAGVEYGVDALRWRPPPAARTCVVMNPPFHAQIAFFNHAATFEAEADLHILWIAGCGARWFDNEAKLAHYMHLVGDYDVPRALQRFDHDGRVQHVRVCVQLWRRASAPRVVRPLPDCDLEFVIVMKEYAAGDVVVKRVGSTNKVGADFELCRDAPTTPTSTDRHVRRQGRDGIRAPVGCREALLARLEARRADRLRARTGRTQRWQFCDADRARAPRDPVGGVAAVAACAVGVTVVFPALFRALPGCFPLPSLPTRFAMGRVDSRALARRLATNGLTLEVRLRTHARPSARARLAFHVQRARRVGRTA